MKKLNISTFNSNEKKKGQIANLVKDVKTFLEYTIQLYWPH